MNAARIAAIFAAGVSAISVAEARETGDIRGEVVDTDGLPVPGAELVLSGEDLAGERRVTTGEDGTFRFDGLLPGTYLLNANWDGSTRASAKVGVNAERSTFVPLTIDLSAETEVVDVIFIQPVIDSTKSAVSHTMTDEYLQNLPVARSYQDVVNTLPGVSGRVNTSDGGQGDGNPSVRGEGSFGNGFAIDGVSTRDPATKTWGQDLNFDAIEEIQVYTDGAPAEFGQFTGMAMNVVTKDGGDEHHGSAAIFHEQHAWVGSERFRKIFIPDAGREVFVGNARSWAPNLAITAGGPIIKEKLWYFGALDLGYTAFQGQEACDAGESVDDCRDRLNTKGARQDRREAQGNTIGSNILAKLTWFPRNDLVVRYLFSGNIGFDQREAAGSLLVAPEADTDRRSSGFLNLLTLTYLPNEKTELVLRAGVNNTTLDVLPRSRDLDTPSYTDNRGVLRGNAPAFDYNDRLRAGGGFTFRKNVKDVAGDHVIKMGAEYWFLKETRDLQNTGARTVDWIGPDGQPTGERFDVGTSFAADPSRGLNCTRPDNSDCAYRVQSLNAGPIGTSVHTFFGFIQDDWQPHKSLTFNVGVRFDLEDGRNNDGDRPLSQRIEEFDKPADQRFQGRFGPFIMLAPRLGMSWDITGDNKTKLSAFYGWYYDIQGSDFWGWSNTRSSDGFMRSERTSAGGSWQWLNTQDNSASPLIYATNLRPAKLEKITIGVEREIIDLFAVGVRGIFSRTNGIPEDVNVDFYNFYIMNSPLKQRFYRAFEVWLEKRFDGNWQALASYTLSEAWGHGPGQYEGASGATGGSNGNGVGVYLDDVGEAPIRRDFYNGGASGLLGGFHGAGRYSVTTGEGDDAGWYGYLPYHSFHSVKINGSYTMPWGTNLGLIYEFDSGHAWQKRTFIPFYGYDGLGQGRGTRFMPAVHYLDMRIAHKFQLRKEQSVEVSFDVFNLPGFLTPITYYENDDESFGATFARQSPRSMRFGLKYRW